MLWKVLANHNYEGFFYFWEFYTWVLYWHHFSPSPCPLQSLLFPPHTHCLYKCSLLRTLDWPIGLDNQLGTPFLKEINSPSLCHHLISCSSSSRYEACESPPSALVCQLALSFGGLVQAFMLLRFHGCNLPVLHRGTVSRQISWSSGFYTLCAPSCVLSPEP